MNWAGWSRGKKAYVGPVSAGALMLVLFLVGVADAGPPRPPGVSSQPNEPADERAAEKKDQKRAAAEEKACAEQHASPASPRTLKATILPSTTDNGQVRLEWAPVPGVAGYEIRASFARDKCSPSSQDPRPSSWRIFRELFAANANDTTALLNELPLAYPVRFTITAYKEITAKLGLVAKVNDKPESVTCSSGPGPSTDWVTPVAVPSKHADAWRTEPRLPPVSGPLSIPPGDDIILYVHGGPSSRLEECTDLVPELQQWGLKKGKRYTVIAFDQPNQGYTSAVPHMVNGRLVDHIDHTEVSRAMGFPDDRDWDNALINHSPTRYPLVQFSEDFIIELVKALGLTNRNVSILGGSLGGLLSLRMGHRIDQNWIKKIVSWNPASVWTTYRGDVLKSLALADSPLGRGVQPRWRESEDLLSRGRYFHETFAPPVDAHYVGTLDLYAQPNPEEWWRGGRGQLYGGTQYSDWACKWDGIAAARLEQEEVYNPWLRTWHSRLGGEELLFSFHNGRTVANTDGWMTGDNVDTLPSSGCTTAHPVYKDVTIPTLLAAADDDDWDEGRFTTHGGPLAIAGAVAALVGGFQPEAAAALAGAVAAQGANPEGFHFENRWRRTIEMAKCMTNTPGDTLFWKNTGHSLHNERPHLFADRITSFLGDASLDRGRAKGPLPVRSPVDPGPDESCDVRLWDRTSFPIPPKEVLENPQSAVCLMDPANPGGKFSDAADAKTYSMRLAAPFRQVAAFRDAAGSPDPLFALATAALNYYAGDTVRGNAYADLAVSGRAVYGVFANRQPGVAQVLARVPSLQFPPVGGVTILNPNALLALTFVKASTQDKQAAVQKALARAYLVAWALRAPDVQDRIQTRRTLGWIAVSGEDDVPDRPVNVPSAPYPQFSADVTSHGQTFRVRFMVASPPGTPATVGGILR